MDDSHRRHEKQVVELVERTIIESHTCPPGHDYPGYTPFTSILKEMRYREMGDKRMRLDKIWPSMVKNKNRVLELSAEMRTRGDTKMDCKRAVSATGVIDLEEEVMRGFVHERDRFDGHGIRNILVSDTETLVRSGSHMEWDSHSRRVMGKYVILLTDLGQVRMYVEEEGSLVLAHRFNLPAHLYSFKDIFWNEGKDEIYITGIAPRTHIDDIRDDQFPHSRRGNSPFLRPYALCVISLYPEVVIKYLVRLDSQLFGGQLSGVSLQGETLICFTPRCTNMYNMQRLCREYIQSIPTPTDYGSPTSDKVVLFNMVIDKKPQPIRVVFGCLSGIDISPTTLHVILSYSARGDQICKIQSADGIEPLFVDEWREGVRHSNMVLYPDDATRFHPDHSARILRLDSDRLYCYALESSWIDKNEEDSSRVSLLWSIRLLPPQKARATSPDGDRDMPMHTNIVHSIKLVPGNMLMIIMVYNASMDMPAGTSPPYCYCSIAIFIDARTGRLVRALPVPNTIFFNCDTVQMDVGVLYSMGMTEETDTRNIRIHRFVEKDREKEVVLPKSGVLNRRQRRWKRKLEASERHPDTPNDILSLFPGSHEIV